MMKWWTQEEADTIRQQAAQMEEEGKLTPGVLDIIYHHRLFKLFIPIEMGGAMLSLPEAVKVFEEAARLDGSFGWLITIGSGGGYFAGVFAPEVATKLFTPTEAVVAGSGYVSGEAVCVDGGYQVSGAWRYCSGADYATIYTANCRIKDTEQIRSFIFTPDQVTVQHDWDAHGLRATGSHTIQVSSVFVPWQMTFDIANGRRSYDAVIYRYPFIPFAEVSFAAVCAGICRHYMEEATTMIRVYDRAGDPAASKRYQTVKDVIQAQERLLSAEIQRFYSALDISWQLTQDAGIVAEAVYEEVGSRSRILTSAALSAAQAVYPWLGLSAAMQHSRINRIWRDLHTASQHILLKEF
ncbi:MAG: acyl-CoA dehydrogenase [Bacteroidetes bacterium]|nr:acyl-CoA dehydrogenase [Bacteroidota bacterium]